MAERIKIDPVRVALRLPAAVFGALAPIAAMSSRLTGPPAVRYTWAVLLACWIGQRQPR